MIQCIDADYVLQMAQRVEQNGEGFYLLAARGMTELANRHLLLGLARQEAAHARTFAGLQHLLAGRAEVLPPSDPDGPVARFIRTLYTGRFFDPAAQPGQYLRGDESRQEIVEMAIGFEKESIVFYEGLKQLLAPQEACEVDAIIREETRHISALASLLTPLPW